MSADADIFISFPGKDRKVATTLCSALESRGFTCWISARDINPGENFQIAIVRAIRKAKVMLLVFTANSNQSEEMSKELALASQQKLAVIPLRVEDVTPNDAFAYEFATRQWIDFFADWEYAIDQLAAQIAKITAPDPALTASGRTGVKETSKAASANSKVKVGQAATAKSVAKDLKAPAAEPDKPDIVVPGPELVPVLDSQTETAAEGMAAGAYDEPAARKGMNPLMMAGAAIAVVAVVGVAVFAFSGKKGPKADAREPAPSAAITAPPVNAPPAVPAPPTPAAPDVAAAATPAAADVNPAAPPTAPAPAPARTKHPVKKAHAPLRASRSDLPY
jgi:hypothetical protein